MPRARVQQVDVVCAGRDGRADRLIDRPDRQIATVDGDW
jgi:hypothetical protein